MTSASKSARPSPRPAAATIAEPPTPLPGAATTIAAVARLVSRRGGQSEPAVIAIRGVGPVNYALVDPSRPGFHKL